MAPRLGLGFGIRHLLEDSGHPVLASIIVLVVIVALAMALRNSRRH